MTDGSNGAWASCDSGMLHRSAFSVEVVDTVGAGDAFHGGLVWALNAGSRCKKHLNRLPNVDPNPVGYLEHDELRTIETGRGVSHRALRKLVQISG